MKTSKQMAWKPLLAACIIALLVLPAAASAMEYADVPAIAFPHGHPNTPVTTSVVHEVRTVRTGDRTLSLVLSAAALGIALGGTAYMTFRLSPRTGRARRPTAGA
jgi:hypothetical protein